MAATFCFFFTLFLDINVANNHTTSTTNTVDLFNSNPQNKLKCNDSIIGSTTYKNPIDYYQLNLVDNGAVKYSVLLNASYHTYLRLYHENGSLISECDNCGMGYSLSRNVLNVQSLNNGRYILGISNNIEYGPYDIQTICVHELKSNIKTEVTVLNLASYTIAQNAFIDAPERYSYWIQQAVDYANQQTIPEKTDCKDSHCCTEYKYVVESFQFTVNPTTDVTISIVSGGINVNVVSHLTAKGKFYAIEGFHTWFGCVHDWWCGWNDASIDGTITMSIKVNIVWDATKLSVTLSPGTVQSNAHLELHTSSLCADAARWWYWVEGSSLNHIIDAAIQQQITEESNKYEKNINAPQEIEIYDGIKIKYFYTFIGIAAGSHIHATANGTLYAQPPGTGNWIAFSVGKANADMPLPNIWPPYTTSIQQNDEEMYFLNGLRSTSSFLQGIIWAANVRGELTPVYNFTVLDSLMDFHLIWDEPKVGVPSNGTLTFDIGYGLVNGTCWKTTDVGPHNNVTIVLQFYFTNLTSIGNISLISTDSNVTLAVQISKIDTSSLNPVLIKPKLPLPTDIVHNMMVLLINSSISLINSFFQSNSVNIPSEFSQWIPDPELLLVHQPGCCNDTHGYLQFFSMCSCHETNSQYKPCSNHLSCTTTAKDKQKDMILFGNNNIHKNTTPIKTDTISNYGIWWYSYQSDVSESCSFANKNDNAAIIYLKNTDGGCNKLPVPIQSNLAYYSLTMKDEKSVNNIKLSCNHNCTLCHSTISPVEVGSCYQPQSSTPIHYSFLLNSSESICIGGNTNLSDNDIVFVAYNNTKTCSSNSVISGVHNFGNIINQCTQYGNGSYMILSISNNVYSIKYGCTTPQCMNCTIQQPIVMDQCTYTNGTYYSYKVLFGNETKICGHKLKPQSVSHHTVAFIIIIWFIIALILGCIVMHYHHYKKCKQTDTDTYWIRCGKQMKDLCCKPMVKYLIMSLKYMMNKIIASFKWIKYSFESPMNIYQHYIVSSKNEMYQHCLLLLASIISYITYRAWHNQSPWRIFDESGFEKIGVPSDTLNITDLTDVLNKWEFGCEVFFISFSCIFLSFFLFRFICIREPFGISWTTFRATLLLLYLYLTFLITFLLIPTFYSFATSIKLNPDDSNTFTNSDDIQDTVNSFIGYAFCGVFLSFFSNIVLYFVYSVPVGIYIISLFYIQKLISFKSSNTLINKKEPGYKSKMIARIIIILFVIQSMAACIESLPVVIMYQSFGTSGAWIISWLIWWIAPTLLLCHVWSVCNKYVKSSVQYNNNQISAREFNSISIKLRRKIKINMIIIFLLYVTVAVITIYCEKHNTLIAVWFTSISCVTGIINGGIAWIYVMHFMFHKLELQSADAQLKMNDGGGVQKLSVSAVDEEELKYESLKDETSTIDELEIDHSQVRHRGSSLHKNNNEYFARNRKKGCCDILYKILFCSFWYKVYVYLFELDEKKDIKKYGARVKWRRMCLILGCLSYGYSSIKGLSNTLNETTKQWVARTIDNMGWNVTWPSDDNGGSLFDTLFGKIDTIRTIGGVLSVEVFILFTIALGCDLKWRNATGLRRSQVMGWAAVLVLFAVIFIPALPNYLSYTPMNAICPHCGPQFNRAVQLLFGDIVGLSCGGLFIIEMLPIVLGTLVPAIVRSGVMVLKRKKEYSLDNNIEKDTVSYVIITGAMLSPFITFVPLLLYQQIEGDIVTGILLIIFWSIPIFISSIIVRYPCLYYIYMLSYYLLLLSIFIYHSILYGLPHWIVQALLDPETVIDFIVESIAEVAFTIVLLSDFIYNIILGLRYN